MFKRNSFSFVGLDGFIVKKHYNLRIFGLDLIDGSGAKIIKIFKPKTF